MKKWFYAMVCPFEIVKIKKREKARIWGMTKSHDDAHGCYSSVQFSSLLEAGPGYGPLFPDLRITFLRRVLRTIRFCNGQMDIQHV